MPRLHRRSSGSSLRSILINTLSGSELMGGVLWYGCPVHWVCPQPFIFSGTRAFGPSGTQDLAILFPLVWTEDVSLDGLASHFVCNRPRRTG